MDKHEAAVVGGSLMTFMPGISERQRNAVQLAVLMAERITQSDHREGLVQDWYSQYRRQLQFFGWDAMPPEEAHWPDPRRPVIVDKALQKIDAVAGERYASSVSLSLRALLRSGTALLHLEARSRELGLFQLLPCAPSKGGYVDMVVYHEAGDRSQFTANFLCRERESTVIRAELVRFNVRLFEQEFQDKVQQRLEKVLRQEILAVDL